MASTSEYFDWVREAQIPIAFVLICLVSVLWGWHVFFSDVSIRLAGLIPQMSGMILAINGLLKVRDYFGQPALWKVGSDWLNRCPSAGADIHASGEAKLTVTVGATLPPY